MPLQQRLAGGQVELVQRCALAGQQGAPGGFTCTCAGEYSGATCQVAPVCGDGKVNDGSELFGTKSGNGFADLAKFDQDGNNWIDQADAIFKKLKIWLKDAAGKDSLIDLSQAKIGAIFLGNTKTDFKHADANNNTNGNLRSSGVYLKDDGKAGSVQQIDLAV